MSPLPGSFWTCLQLFYRQTCGCGWALTVGVCHWVAAVRQAQAEHSLLLRKTFNNLLFAHGPLYSIWRHSGTPFLHNHPRHQPDYWSCQYTVTCQLPVHACTGDFMQSVVITVCYFLPNYNGTQPFSSNSTAFCYIRYNICNICLPSLWPTLSLSVIQAIFRIKLSV